MAPDVYLHLDGAAESERNLGSQDLTATWYRVAGSKSAVRLPDGQPVGELRAGDYVQVPSNPTLSVDATGEQTVVAWIKPSTLEFEHPESTGYVNWMGKGSPGHQEWLLRMYSKTNAERRPNRISAYVFNPRGGLGSGAYFQDRLSTSAWIMVAFEVTTRPSGKFPTGSVSIWKDGLIRGTVGLDQFDVVPRAGDAPLKIGTQDGHSWFQGAIGDVAIFDRLLPSSYILELYRDMVATTH